MVNSCSSLISLDQVYPDNMHDIADVPVAFEPGIKLVITGYSHKPLIEWRSERLFLNPGSAGRRRFKLPVTLVLFEVLVQLSLVWSLSTLMTDICGEADDTDSFYQAAAKHL
jgi:predicted phosphodiesterase